MLRTSLSVSLDVDPQSVGIARTTCRAALDRLGVTEQCAFDVELVLAEACTNAVEHSRPPGGAARPIEVHLDVNGTWCHIEVIDHGAGFDPGDASYELPGPEEARGRGLALMNEMADHLVLHSTVGAGTRVLLAKHLDVEGWSPLAPGAPQSC